ncbi:DUF6907 domain-containing protein [Nocardia arizonensis]
MCAASRTRLETSCQHDSDRVFLYLGRVTRVRCVASVGAANRRYSVGAGLARGDPLSGDLWGVVVAVVFSCPSWCVDHRDPVPGDPGDGGAHYGPELMLILDDTREPDLPRQVRIQVAAHDRDGRRRGLIGLVDPCGMAVELSPADARDVAAILLRGADLRLAPAEGTCPVWCLGHTASPGDGFDTIVEHRGPFMAVLPSESRAGGVMVSVRVTAIDEQDSREVCLELVVRSIATELTGADACRIAAHLLNSADQIDGG